MRDARDTTFAWEVERHMPMTFPRTITLTLSLACAGLLLPAAAGATQTDRGLRATANWGHEAEQAPARRAQQDCENANLQPTGANVDAVRTAIVCLHNRVRADRGLPPLRENARLRTAADGHTRDMVSRGYFDHVSPSGATMIDRIFRARYTNRSEAWSLGENLAWGTGSHATPRGVMRTWMQSSAHRTNMLKRAYREIGIGVATGTPAGGSRGATYTANFGARR